MIHRLGHRLPGLWKQSYADPDGGSGARMVCVERIQSAVQEVTAPVQNSSQVLPSGSSFVRPPPPPILRQRKDAWSNVEPCDSSLAPAIVELTVDVAPAKPVPRKGRWRRSPLASDALLATVVGDTAPQADELHEVLTVPCKEDTSSSIFASEKAAEVAAQGDLVRGLKSAKAPKAAIDIAVKKLLALKQELATATAMRSVGQAPGDHTALPSSFEQATMAPRGSAAVPGSVCIVLLRDDMRLNDNPALLRAAEGGFDAVVPVYVYSEESWSPHACKGAAKVWKHESLKVFASSLSDQGSRLVVRRGDVASALLQLLAELDPTVSKSRIGPSPRRLVTFNRRCEPYNHSHDEEVAAALRAAGVSVETFAGNVLYEPQDLQPIERWQRWRARVRADEAASRGVTLSEKSKKLEHISGFGSYRFFSHALEELGPPQRPCAKVQRLPSCPVLASCSLESLGLGKTSGYGFPSDFREFSVDVGGRGHSKAQASGAEWDWAAELRRSWNFGEAAALRRLGNFLDRTLASGDFEGRKRLRCDLDNTSELSPYIRFGELSVRTVYWAAKQRKERTSQKLFEDTGYSSSYVSGRHGSTYKGNADEDAKANSTFLRRFIWRDLAYWFLWEFPSLPSMSLRPQYEQEVWAGTRSQLRHWQRGTTGFPLVDAAMRQLWAVGWMPNYLRHIVAQTLIEYLDISWKHGLEWFDYTLVDMDVAINSFMWQNGGHSGPDHWEFVLHPVNAAKTCDPEGNYVRRWLPFLADCPTEFIHRPWDLPARIFRLPTPGIYPARPLIADLDEARRQHLRNVLEVRRKNPEMVSNTGHEWLKLPGRGGLLAKCVTRLEFRAETEDFLLYQSPARRSASAKGAPLSKSRSVANSIIEEMANGDGIDDTHGPGL
eukprot:TRINITY_DN67073_c0_g1_i1.p1 TRINITY_DN67073_c0_g1~~TRINITY_DN67073_c0_g1_i1.p1  ORF type:complete len:1012 (+),score=123.63 TRINITY_DN67073_c0_g1_i1:369-3038(+)